MNNSAEYRAGYEDAKRVYRVRPEFADPTTAVFWLLEAPRPSDSEPPTWWRGVGILDGIKVFEPEWPYTVTPDAAEAIRFPSKDSAIAVRNSLPLLKGFNPTEHIWVQSAEFTANRERIAQLLFEWHDNGIVPLEVRSYLRQAADYLATNWRHP